MIKKRDKILMTGCGGMLGEAVYKEFSGNCEVIASDIDLNEKWLSYLDVSDSAAVRKYCADINPDYIIHLAAKTDMERCEQNVRETYDTNTWGVQNLMLEARKRNIPFLYISTAGIFDGEKEMYSESDMPNPLSIYGKSKYAGELAAKSYEKSVVIRAGWMMGGGPKKDKKFINKIVKQIKSGKTELAIVDDKFGTPCYTYDLAKIIYHLLDNELFGIYHGACEGSANRFEVAKRLIELLGLKDRIKLKKVSSDYFKKDYYAPRPVSEKLINDNLHKLKIKITRDWNECLAEYIKKFDWEAK